MTSQASYVTLLQAAPPHPEIVTGASWHPVADLILEWNAKQLKWKRLQDTKSRPKRRLRGYFSASWEVGMCGRISAWNHTLYCVNEIHFHMEKKVFQFYVHANILYFCEQCIINLVIIGARTIRPHNMTILKILWFIVWLWTWTVSYDNTLD